MWDDIWTGPEAEERERWGFLAELVFREAARCRTPGPVAELGAGSGKMTARFFGPGQPVVYLDRSRPSLRFLAARRPGWTVAGDVRALPFRAGALGWCWSSGVLEHFPAGEQRAILAEMRRATRPGGAVTTIVPCRTYLFRLGKAVLEKLGRWPFGYEEPLATLRPLLPPGARLDAEYPFGCLELGIGLVKTLGWRGLYRLLDGCCLALWRSPLGPLVNALDRLAARAVGGYLLLASFRA